MLNMNVEAFQQVTIDMCHENQISGINYRQVHFVKHNRIKTKNIITCIYGTVVSIQNSSVDGGETLLYYASTVDIQDCQMVDGSIATISSHTVNIWNCAVDGIKAVITLLNANTIDIQNCRVVDGLIATSSSHTVNIWNCTVDGGMISSQAVSSLDIQDCVLRGSTNLSTGRLRTIGVAILQVQRVMIQNTTVSEYRDME